MKNKLIALCLSSLLMLSLAACTGGKESPKTETPNSSTPAVTESQVQSQEEESSNSTTNSAGLYDSIEEFVQSDAIQQQMKAMKSIFEGTGMAVELKADRNKMIYCFTIENEAVVAAVKENPDVLKSTLESQSAVFEGIVDMLKVVVNVENPVVVVQYKDTNGKELYSQELQEQK